MKKVIIIGLVFILSGCSFSGQDVKNAIEKVKNSTVEQESAELEISPEEQEFLDSGRAKAVESEQDLWQIYENKDANFTFRYPHNVKMVEDAKKGDVQLSVQVNILKEVEIPGFTDEDLKEISKKLAKGEYGEDLGWSIENSRRVRELRGINAQDNVVLSRFEVCDVIFERNLIFYVNDYQVVISLIGPREKIIEENKDFFTKDSEDCFMGQVWRFERQSEFYNMLNNNEAKKTTQDWFSSFDELVSTLDVGNLTESDYTNSAIVGLSNLNPDNMTPSLLWPKISGIKKVSAYESIIEVLNFEKNVGKNLTEILNEYSECKCGVMETSYSVNYNDNGVLSISLVVDTVQAYPSTNVNNYLIDLNTGNKLGVKETFRESKITELVKMIDGKLQKTITLTKEAIVKAKLDIPLEQYKGKFTEKYLENFKVTENGITFTYDFDFPQAIKSTEPSPYVFVSFEEMSGMFVDDVILEKLIK